MINSALVDMHSKFYPVSPILTDASIVKPAGSYRKNVFLVICAILLFFLVYLSIIALAFVVLFATLWAGITLIAVKPGFLTLVIGGGMIGLGGMFFLFVFKFVFAKHRDEDPFRVEIKEEDQPELFAFIRALSKDLKVRFPKKIFLSPEVNAGVFYNSGIASLILPVRKNLNIGLGLINGLTVSEFKAIVAHEFGHFSQSSMRLGSYIYTVNRVIYYMVFEQDQWDYMLQKWHDAGGILSFFAQLTGLMANAVRGILRAAYLLVNKSYMSLSREMEYHADKVAASVSGTAALRNALRKTDFIEYAYQLTTDFLDQLTTQNKASKNIYEDHRTLMQFLAEKNEYEIKSGIVQMPDYAVLDQMVKVKSRLVFKDQWASHPSMQERDASLSEINIIANENNNSAWNIFSKVDDFKQALSAQMYKVGFPEQQFELMKPEEFESFYQEQIVKFQVSEVYNGYFDGRYINHVDFEQQTSSFKSFEALYTDENMTIIRQLAVDEADLHMLYQIDLKNVDVRFFEFDGKKYRRNAVKKVIDPLKKSVDEGKSKVAAFDQQVFAYHYDRAQKKNKEAELVELYISYYELVDVHFSMGESLAKMQKNISALHAEYLPEEEVNYCILNLVQVEKEFRKMLTEKFEFLKGRFQSSELADKLRTYVGEDFLFSSEIRTNENAMSNLAEMIWVTNEEVKDAYGLHVKALAEFQLTLEE